MPKGVLVVDDDPDARRLARMILEQAGIHVEEAEDVQDFFSMLESGHDPEVVVLDLTMPGPSGWTALNKLRADPARAHLPIVIVTSHDDDQFRATAKRAGVKHYITKPYKPWALLDAVQSSGAPPSTDPWARGR